MKYFVGYPDYEGNLVQVKYENHDAWETAVESCRRLRNLYPLTDYGVYDETNNLVWPLTDDDKQRVILV